jgi:hypothetical protein
MTQRSRCYLQIALGLFAFAAIGCAASVPEPKDGRAAGEWRYRLPATQSPFGKLALGSGGSSEPAVIEPEQELLAAQAPAPKRAVQPQRARKSAEPVAQPEPLAAIPASAPAQSAPPPQLEEPTQLALNDVNPEQRYAQRQSESKQLEQYRGGDAIVISGGVLLVVLLIVILVLLLR